ncbi:MAG: HAMP domain-containing sensor histidine kinase, partial [Acidobacteriota bacterium]
REQVDGELLLQAVSGGEAGLGTLLEPETLALDPDAELDLDAEPEAMDLADEQAVTPGFCLPREWFFDADTEALMVRAFDVDDPTRIVPLLRSVIAAWAFGTLMLVGWGAFALATRPVALVADLGRAREQIDRGDLGVRLRRRDAAGDLERASSEINAILDRLGFAVTTLEAVSDNIAHDLRTPLTRLQGQLDLLRRSEAPTPTMIEAVQDEAGQLLATFNALLRIARVESGTRKKGFRRIDLVPVIQDVGELYAPAMSEGSLDFACRTPGGSVSVDGDPDLWMQALSNLLDNALKYTPTGGRVELELTPGVLGNGARIRLHDSGSGIPDGEMDKVFQRFYRLSEHRKQRGSGLGLSLVAAICDLHGAAIGLANRDGLEVTIDVPASDDQPLNRRSGR